MPDNWLCCTGLVSYLPVADSNLFDLKDGNCDLAVKALEFANAKVWLACHSDPRITGNVLSLL